MLRQVSSRNSRSKGPKPKKVVQIALLLIVTVWLLFQVKHSYDKKKAYDSHSLEKEGTGEGSVLQLGRKDLPPRVEVELTVESPVEEEEMEEIEQEMKHEDGEEYAVDEQDQEKEDGDDIEVDESGVFEDQEHKELLHQSEKIGSNIDDHQVSGIVANETSSADKEDAVRRARERSFHDDNASSGVRHGTPASEREQKSLETREKSFKGDDASSAVGHNTVPDAHVEVAETKAESIERFSQPKPEVAVSQPSASATDKSKTLSGDHKDNSTSESKIANTIPKDPTNSTTSNRQGQDQTSSTPLLINQIELFTNLTTANSAAADTINSTGEESHSEGGQSTIQNKATSI